MYIHAGSKGLKKSFQEKEDSKAEEEELGTQTNHPIITIDPAGKHTKPFSWSKRTYTKKGIRKEIQKHCKKSVTVFTDEYTIYFNLKTHKMVKKHLHNQPFQKTICRR
jgi:hypothetical protein